MENVELLKDWCQKFFAAPVRTVCCFLLFYDSMHLSELRFASLLFQTHWKKRKKNCTNPSDSQQLWFYSLSSLALSSSHQKKVRTYRNNAVKWGKKKEKDFQTFWAQLSVLGGICGFLPSLSQRDWAVLAVGVLPQLLLLNSTFLWSLDSLL